MKKREDNIDWLNQIGAALSTAEEVSPAGGWERLSRELETPAEDWLNQIGAALGDAEEIPPAGGWARLEGALNKPKPRVIMLGSSWMRVAAAVAAVLVLGLGTRLLLRENRSLKNDSGEVALSADSPTLPPSYEEAGFSFEDGLRAIAPLLDEVRQATLPIAKTGGRTSAKIADATTPLPEVPAEEVPLTTDTKDNKSSAEQSKAEPAEPVKRSEVPDRPIYYEENKPFIAVTSRKKVSASLFAAGSVNGGGAAAGKGMVMSGMSLDASDGAILHIDYAAQSFRHHQPLSFGLSLRKEFSHGLSLESGVNYTLLWSDVKVGANSEHIHQKLHFIGVPLRVNWRFFNNNRDNFSLYMSAGGMLEKCISAKYGTSSVKEDRLQWSALGAVGVQYDLGKVVGLYFEPEVSYYFTKTSLITSRTDSPLSVTLRIGVRFTF